MYYAVCVFVCFHCGGCGAAMLSECGLDDGVFRLAGVTAGSYCGGYHEDKRCAKFF